MNDLGVSGKIRRVIQSIYNNTKIQIRIGSKLSEHAEINRGVRQGCPLSCVLFNMYMDHMVKEWQKKDPKGIQMDQQQEISTVLFADDQAVLAETEDDLQRAMYQLAKTSEAYDMKISSGKTKTMAFKGKDAIRSKIVIDGKIIEQVNTFRYLGNEMSYQGEVDVGGKIAKFLRVTGLINRTLRNNKVQKETRLKVYNTLAVPMITYGCEGDHNIKPRSDANHEKNQVLSKKVEKSCGTNGGNKIAKTGPPVYSCWKKEQRETKEEDS